MNQNNSVQVFDLENNSSQNCSFKTSLKQERRFVRAFGLRRFKLTRFVFVTLGLLVLWSGFMKPKVGNSGDLTSLKDHSTFRPNAYAPRVAGFMGDEFICYNRTYIPYQIITSVRDSQYVQSHTDWRHDSDISYQTKLYSQNPCGLEPRYATPTCNLVHEVNILDHFPLEKLGSGQKRITFKLQIEDIGIAFKSIGSHENVTPDTLKLNRIDAMTAERLTSSSKVIDIYGYCAESMLLELAQTDFMHYLGINRPRMSLTPKELLEYARDAAFSLSDLHKIKYPDFIDGTMVHRDVRPWNFLLTSNATLKLHDFNSGRFLPQNPSGSYQICRWQHRPVKCNGNRSPEECCGTCNLTDKTDVYNLGNFFYFLLTNGLLPYHDISNKTLTNEKIRNGMLAVLPKYVEQSDNPAVLVIKQARLIAQQKEPLKRPTSHQLALWLSSMYDKLYS